MSVRPEPVEGSLSKGPVTAAQQVAIDARAAHDWAGAAKSQGATGPAP